MSEILLLAKCANETCVLLRVFFCPVHGCVEICFNLEEFVEIRVENIQLLIEVGVSNEDHLNVQRNRLGLETLCRNKTQSFFRLFDNNVLVSQSSFQAIIREWIAKQLLNRKNQISPVSLVHRSTADHGEGGDKGAKLSFLLNSSEEILICW